jgi:preprotein translocase subunit SecA
LTVLTTTNQVLTEEKANSDITYGTNNEFGLIILEITWRIRQMT